MAAPIKVNDLDFQTQVLNSDLPVVTDFWAEWCGPCKSIAPILDEIAREYDGKVTIAKLNVDENPSTAMAYGVMSIPTLIVFKQGRQVARIVGMQPKQRLVGQIVPHLS